MGRPSFIGVGVQKCASTWIHRVLEDHPQVSVSQPKELDFFSYHFHFGFQWYEKHFDILKISGENSPSYFCDFRVPERVISYSPDVKIVICLRDPVERIISHHAHEVRLGHVDSGVSYTDALRNNPMYLEQSMYAKYLSRWLDLFPANQLLVVFQEQIKDSPESVACKLYEFLGVATDFKSDFIHKRANASQVPKSTIIPSFFKSAATIFRRIGLGKTVDIIRKSAWAGQVKNKNMRDIRITLPSMTGDELDIIDKELKDDLVKLGSMLDVDLRIWASWRRMLDTQ